MPTRAADERSDVTARALLARWCGALEPAHAPRALVIAAHPDDDILGLGARMRVVGSRLDVVFVSDGAPHAQAFHRSLGLASREDYARVRRDEAHRALRLAGVGAERTHELGAVDQAVMLELPRVTRALGELMRRTAPDVVITHAYEGGHPDHDATACAAHVALHRLAREHGGAPPLLEFAGYHARGPSLVRGSFIAHPAAPHTCVKLDAEARAFKRRLLACHASQEAVWCGFPLEQEQFRAAPRYDFGAPPAPELHYEALGWGICFADFRERTCALLEREQIEGPC